MELNERKALALRMLEDGEHVKDIAMATGFSEGEIRSGCLKWADEVSDISSQGEDKRSRFFREAQDHLTPSTKLMEVMPVATKMLESGDIEGFFSKVAPIAAIQMAYDSVMVADDKVRQTAQKDILDRAGFKPREKIEVYSKYDGMQKNEIIGLVRGILMQKPELLHQLARAQEQVMEEAKVIPVTVTSSRDGDQ